MIALTKRMALLALTSALLIGAGIAPIPSAALGSTTTVAPLEDATTILQNPFMGFEDQDVHRNWWPSSTGYLRAVSTCEQNGKSIACGPLNWDRLNPQPNTYNFSDIDLFIANMAAQQKFVQFRIRNVTAPGTLPTIPAWAKQAGVTWSKGQEPFGGPLYPEIDYKKCVFLDLWGKLVQAMVQRYDKNPQVSVIDIGSYGWYGEWYSGKTVLVRFPTYQVYDPTDPTLPQSIDIRTRIVRMFTGGSGSGRCIDNNGKEQIVSYSYPGFKNKPVLINRGDQEDVQIGIANGAGIRFDGIGASDSRNADFRQRIGGMVNQIWQTKPIMGEFGTPDYAPLNSGFMQRSLCFAREFHVSAIHNNFDSKPGFDLSPLFRELGYRISLNRVSYPTNVTAGMSATFNFTWVNKGTSPAYQRYPLKLYFMPAGADSVASEVDLSNTDIRKILPAGVSATSVNFLTCPKATPTPVLIAETIKIPALASGAYDLYFGFQEPVYQKPIQLALSKKDHVGRYLLGRINVSRPGVTVVTSPLSTITQPGLTSTPTNIPPTFQPPTAIPVG